MAFEKAEKDGYLNRLANEHSTSFKDLTDLEGLIIRGHILIEKALNNSIATVAYKKDEFNPDQFTFAQKASLARLLGISGVLKNEINAFNKLRNQIAHSLEFEEKYLNVIINGIKSKDKEKQYPKTQKVNNLKRAISFMCGIIAIDAYFAQAGQALKGLSFIDELNDQ